MLRAASLIIAPGREPFPGLVEIRDTASTDFARRTYRATGLVLRSTTGANGVYVVPLLPPGVYDSCEYPWRSAKC